MIITTPKSWQEIEHAIAKWQIHKAIVVSCGSCSAHCGTGGTQGLEKLLASLSHLDMAILASIVVQDPCDMRNIRRDFRYISDELEATDGVIVASCGLGAQSIAEIVQKPVIVTTDTVMMAETIRIGDYTSKCVACGNCVLNETGGICPVTMCAKSMLNGPCGGMHNGKCEVASPERDCAWVLIYQRLAKLTPKGRPNNFIRYTPPPDWRQREQFHINTQEARKSYYEYQECGEDDRY
jgi:ferredoxin